MAVFFAKNHLVSMISAWQTSLEKISLFLRFSAEVYDGWDALIAGDKQGLLIVGKYFFYQPVGSPPFSIRKTMFLDHWFILVNHRYCSWFVYSCWQLVVSMSTIGLYTLRKGRLNTTKCKGWIWQARNSCAACTIMATATHKWHQRPHLEVCVIMCVKASTLNCLYIYIYIFSTLHGFVYQDDIGHLMLIQSLAHHCWLQRNMSRPVVYQPKRHWFPN